MRNREFIVGLLERIEGKMSNLRLIVKTQQPVSDYMKLMEETAELIDQIKTMISREPLSAEEMNSSLKRD